MQNKVLQNRLKRLERRANKDKTHFVFFGQPKRSELAELPPNAKVIIFVGEDIDVLIELCDRIMVMNSGKITGIVDGRTATKEEIGLMMTKHGEEE